MDNVDVINLIPENDSERVKALQRYQIFNSHRETAFDSICELACELFSCPISHISFLNEDTEFIKAGVGINGITHVSRSEGICALAIQQPELLLIEDASRHELLADHPYVTGELKIRFYAAAPVITHDGFIIGTLCIIDTKPRMITEKEKQILTRMSKVVMEQTELRLNNLELLRQKDEFIDIAAHEMRTPLTTLRAAVQLLQNDIKKSGGNPDGMMIKQAIKSVSKLNHLVNGLFDASQMAGRKFKFEKTVFSIGSLINNCYDMMTILGKDNLKVEGDTGLNVLADAPKIEQVITNLVGNAIKYAPASPYLYIRIEQQPGFARISVVDNGPGIVAEKLPHLFRRYFRAEPDGHQTGLGLGLYISAEIIKYHGGEIGVQSEPGEGCTFWFTLPLA